MCYLQLLSEGKSIKQAQSFITYNNTEMLALVFAMTELISFIPCNNYKK